MYSRQSVENGPSVRIPRLCCSKVGCHTERNAIEARSHDRTFVRRLAHVKSPHSGRRDLHHPELSPARRYEVSIEGGTAKTIITNSSSHDLGRYEIQS